MNLEIILLPKLKINIDKYLIVLSVTAGSISIESFAAVIGAPSGIPSANVSLAFLNSTGIVKKLL